ncbi:hypothetical protein X943_002781 [Babesia divergens]|uniref:Uncharacterized protein n=1 Tax=Babesia divergens TaxID=32595 RepID=A0AAD9GDC9_BABDI|nr:hypothetical protein X943_002781 [Babesia divergens]
MSEEERLKVCSTLDTLFSRCVTACENDSISTVMSAIMDYINMYGSFFSPFFENPVEVHRQSAVDEVVGDGIGDPDLSHNAADKSSCDGSSEAQNEVDVASASSDKCLNFYYTVDDVGPDGKNECRRWYVSIKPGVSRAVRRLILQYRKRCMGIMGRAMHKVSTMEDLIGVTRVSREASRFGMTVTKAMYDAMSVIHAKLGRFEKALGYIERMWLLGERRRYRSYEPLLTYFEEHLDGEGMISVLHHMVDRAGLPMSGLMFSRAMVTLGLLARRRLLELRGHSVPPDDITAAGRHYEVDFDSDTPAQVTGSYNGHGTARNTAPTTVAEVYTTLKRQMHEVLDIYHKNSFNRISLSSRLGYVISSVFESVVPGVVQMTHVSPSDHQSALKSGFPSPSELEEADRGGGPVADPYGHKGPVGHSQVYTGSHGACFSCGEKLHLVDLPVEDRLSVFRSWLQHIYDYNFPEIVRLANFYSWIYADMREGRGYTCILDGQNIGYHKRQLVNPLDLAKIDTVVREMVDRGERPLIVLPYYARVRADSSKSDDVVEPETLSLLFPGHNLPRMPIVLSNKTSGRPKRYSPEEVSILDRWCNARQAYFCAHGSYDDNYFFMANVMTGCAEELEVMARFLRSSLELSFAKNGNKGDSTLISQLPAVTLEDYAHIAGHIPRRPVMITVTNDTFTNLEIPTVDESLMRALRDIPLTPYLFSGQATSRGVFGSHRRSAYGYKVLVGNRLRYSLEMQDSGTGMYHIPLGYERKVIDYRARHTLVVHKNSQPRVEPPLSGHMESPVHSGEPAGHNVDQEIKQINTWLEKYGYDKLLSGLDATSPDYDSYRRKSRGYVISTKTPEIIMQKFNPSQQTRWLCVDLNRLDRLKDH